MKSVLYQLLLALVPDLPLLDVGAHRRSDLRSAPHLLLVFEVRERRGSVLLCSLTLRTEAEEDAVPSPCMAISVDAGQCIVRPLHYRDRMVYCIAGDEAGTVDVEAEMEQASLLLGWLCSARSQAHRFHRRAHAAGGL
ncbi:MAG: hypothetical protein WCA12_09445 [Burkholderiales bacterium]